MNFKDIVMKFEGQMQKRPKTQYIYFTQKS